MIDKNQIVLLMEEILYSPGDHIFEEGNMDDCSLYYIVKGSVQLLNEKKGCQEVIISTKEKQQYFGEISFITGFNRRLSARANDFCRVYKIQRQIFLDKIKTNAHDFEKFQMLKDIVIFKDNYKYGKFRCYTCNSENHYSSHCPKTHLVITQSSVKSRFSYYVPQENRIKEGRVKRKKFKGLKISQECDRAVTEINNNEEYFDILDEIELGFNKTERFYTNEFNDEFLECIEEEDEFDRESTITPTQKQYFRNRSIRSNCSSARQNRLQPSRRSQDLSIQWNQTTTQSSYQDLDRQNQMSQSKETQKQAKSLLSQSYQSSSSSSSVESSQSQSPTTTLTKKVFTYQDSLNENNSQKQKNLINQLSKLSLERKKTLQDQENINIKQLLENNQLEIYKQTSQEQQISDNKIQTYKTFPDILDQNVTSFSALIQSEGIESANHATEQNQLNQIKKIDPEIENRIKNNSISSIGSNQNSRIPQRYIQQQEKKISSQLSINEQQKMKEGLQNISTINQEQSNISNNSKLFSGFESSLQNKYERSGSIKKSYLSHQRQSYLSSNGRRPSSKFKRSLQNQEQLQQSIGLFINNLNQENPKQLQFYENGADIKKRSMSIKPSQFSLKNPTMQSIGNLHLSVVHDQSKFIEKNISTKFEEKNLTNKNHDNNEISQFLIELESAQMFRYYFPHYNYLKVLEKWQKYQNKKNKGKKQYHKKKFNSKIKAFQTINA